MSKYLTDREFGGIIGGELLTVTDDDPSNRGRYRVLIPELMGNCYDDGDAPIFCTNQVTKYRNTICNVGSGIYGQYFPLHPGTKVIVKFCNEDYQSGYIDRIIGDYYENSLPMALDTKDRDQYYQLLRTIDNDLIAVTCDTISENVPNRGFHIYHKKDNIMVIFDDTGIHVYDKKDLDTQIDGKAYIKVNDQVDCVFGSKVNISIAGDCNVDVASNCNLTVGGNCSTGVTGNCELKVGGNCNVDGALINLNCGLSKAPSISKIAEKEKTNSITFDEKTIPNVKI